MTAVQRFVGPDGTDVTIDHDRQRITGRAAYAPPDPCPHSHVVWDDGGKRSVQPCTGQQGHLSHRHADREGRVWD